MGFHDLTPAHVQSKENLEIQNKDDHHINHDLPDDEDAGNDQQLLQQQQEERPAR